MDSVKIAKGVLAISGLVSVYSYGVIHGAQVYRRLVVDRMGEAGKLFGPTVVSLIREASNVRMSDEEILERLAQEINFVSIAINEDGLV